MICKELTVRDFRNIPSAHLTFSEGTNLLYGNNAEGKTNLIEAIYAMSIGKPFRASKLGETVRFGCDSAEIALVYENRNREETLVCRFDGRGKRAVEINGYRAEKYSEMIGRFSAVLFSPDHLSLVKDGPAERRNFLDIALSRASRRYLVSLQRYAKILKERNALLRRAKEDGGVFRETVDAWSLPLAREAAYLRRERVIYLEKLSKYAKECFSEMTGDREAPLFTYRGNFPPEEDGLDLQRGEEAFYSLLSSHHDREIAFGSTLYGIHRDDIEITLSGLPARTYASQGQQRSLSLAMKLAEGEIIKEETGDYPVFLFDDVLSELDGGRREYLLSRIKGKQVILTSCETPERYPEMKQIRVEKGQYFEEE